MAEWHKQRLDSVAIKITDGSHNPPKGVQESEYLMLSSKNVFDDDLHYADPRYLTAEQFRREDKRTGIVPGDVLLTIVGTVGRSAVVPADAPRMTLQRSVAVIRPNEQIVEPRFLMYSFIERNVELNEKARGVAQKGIYLETLRELEVMLPSIPEQQRIVGILDEAFDGIAAAKANAKKNLQNARALFESHLQSVFTERGEGWVQTPLGDVCGFVRGPFGGSLKKSIFVDDGYAVYEQQHAIYDQFDDVRYFVDESKFKEMKRFELRPNDLIMSCSGTMGRVAIVPQGIKQGIINQALLKLTPSNKISNLFLKDWMESEAFQDALKEYSGGAAIQNVASVKILKEIRIPLPSVKEQERVVDKLDSVREVTQRLETIYQKKVAALEILKKSLLNQAFSGAL